LALKNTLAYFAAASTMKKKKFEGVDWHLVTLLEADDDGCAGH
jgi:hypothetical protein